MIFQILEEENTTLKDKVSILKDKLTEATQLIDNLTEQIMAINNECSQLKGKNQMRYKFQFRNTQIKSLIYSLVTIIPTK